MMSSNPPVVLLFAMQVAGNRSDELTSIMEELVATQKSGCQFNLRTNTLDAPPMLDPAYR